MKQFFSCWNARAQMQCYLNYLKRSRNSIQELCDVQFKTVCVSWFNLISIWAIRNDTTIFYGSVHIRWPLSACDCDFQFIFFLLTFDIFILRFIIFFLFWFHQISPKPQKYDRILMEPIPRSAHVESKSVVTSRKFCGLSRIFCWLLLLLLLAEIKLM